MTTDSNAAFSRRVYAVVRRVPRGKVATYGQIAALVGHPGAARAVGTALARLPRHLQNAVPWHRIIAATGVSRRRSPDGAATQRDLLRAEDIEVRASGGVDLRRFQWNGGRRPRSSRAAKG